MNDNAYSQFPYRTPGCVLPSPGALLGGSEILFGIENRNEHRRCLDIGCGTGGSTMHLACQNPEIEFTGIDLSDEQIRMANEEARKRNASNIHFQCLNVMDLPTDKHFDVIYSYGVLSYCPPDIRKLLLQKIREVLVPNGVALISYNVFPGWHQKGILRDLMLLETDRSQSPAEQVQTAKSFVRFYMNTMPENSVNRFLIQQVYQNIDAADDTYLFHEYLEEENHAFRFHEFARMCEESGLTFLSEFPFVQSRYTELNIIPKFVPYLRKCFAEDRLKYENAMDLVLWRSFRRSILVRNGREIDKEDLSRMRNCRFAIGPLSFAAQQSIEDIQPESTLDISAPYGGKHTFDTPHEIATLFLLREEQDYPSLWQAIQNVPAVQAAGRLDEETFLHSLMKLTLHALIIPNPIFSDS